VVLAITATGIFDRSSNFTCGLTSAWPQKGTFTVGSFAGACSMPMSVYEKDYIPTHRVLPRECCAWLPYSGRFELINHGFTRKFLNEVAC
jgi:hypothetical protein